MEIAPESLDIETMRSRLGDIAEIWRTFRVGESEMDSSDLDKMVYDLASQIQKNVDQIVSEFSEIDALGDEDLEACLAHLEKETGVVEEEKEKLSNEVAVLTQSFSEDLTCLEAELERLTSSIDHIASKDLECSSVAHGHLSENRSLGAPLYDAEFEMMELRDQIEKNNKILQSLQELDVLYRRFEAVESIEDTLTGVRVLSYEKDSIRFAVRTHIARLGGSFPKPTIDDISDLSLDHEVSIKLIDGTLEPENLEVIPNDIHFDEILVAAKSVSHTKALEWLVRKVQDRIVICTLRRNIVKAANNSRSVNGVVQEWFRKDFIPSHLDELGVQRFKILPLRSFILHSFEYNDGEEAIISHMVGEFDAYIKAPIGWPIIDSPLKLISLKSPDQKRISRAFICKVQESANSLDIVVRQNLQSFADAIDEILVQQMHVELHR